MNGFLSIVFWIFLGFLLIKTCEFAIMPPDFDRYKNDYKYCENLTC